MGKFEIDGEEAIEREVKATGNGAHVYVPKDWESKTVKVIRLSEEEYPDFEQCDVCGKSSTDCLEWSWSDKSGASIVIICSDCRTQIKRSPLDVCPICREDRKMSRSKGFGPMGPEASNYDGCDTCRERVIFGNKPNPQPAWFK